VHAGAGGAAAIGAKDAEKRRRRVRHRACSAEDRADGRNAEPASAGTASLNRTPARPRSFAPV